MEVLTLTRRSTRSLLLLGALAAAHGSAAAQTLEGFAAVSGRHLRAGPTSGQFIAPAAMAACRRSTTKQPVQGISSVLRAWNGDFWSCRTTASARRRTLPTTSSASTASIAGLPDQARRSRHHRRRVVHHASRSQTTRSISRSWPTARSTTRQHDSASIRPFERTPAADRRRLRHRVDPRGATTARCGSATSSVRFCFTPTRTGRVLEAPYPLPGRASRPRIRSWAAARRTFRGAEGFEGHGDHAATARRSIRCSRAR